MVKLLLTTQRVCLRYYQLKFIADEYKNASKETFKKLKLYLIQPSDKVHSTLVNDLLQKWFWQLCSCEKKVMSAEKFEDRGTFIGPLIKFMLNLKSCLQETMEVLEELKKEDEENEANYDSENDDQVVLLSTIICPKTFKISYNTHGQRFQKEHFKSSPESDY